MSADKQITNSTVVFLVFPAESAGDRLKAHYKTGQAFLNILKKIFADNELIEDSVVRKFRITATDNKSYDTVLMADLFPLLT
jgi:hypothetical protein